MHAIGGVKFTVMVTGVVSLALTFDHTWAVVAINTCQVYVLLVSTLVCAHSVKHMSNMISIVIELVTCITSLLAIVVVNSSTTVKDQPTINGLILLESVIALSAILDFIMYVTNRRKQVAETHWTTQISSARPVRDAISLRKLSSVKQLSIHVVTPPATAPPLTQPMLTPTLTQASVNQDQLTPIQQPSSISVAIL